MSKPKVLVAMSGRLMSSVVAAILKRQGYQVLGLHLALPGSSQEQAEKTAQKLGISSTTIDVRDYWEYRVVDRLVHSMLDSKLPEPQLWGTQDVLVETLLKKAEELRCEFVATGHFARIAIDPAKNRSRLLKTPEGDQSHLLYRIASENLGKFILPAGDLSVSGAEKLAIELDLDIEKLKDSGAPGFSVISEQDFIEITATRIAPSLRMPGQVKFLDGSVLSDHQGIYRFRVGQKIAQASGRGKTEGSAVLRIDHDSSSVIVGPESSLFTQQALAEKGHWICPMDGLGLLRCMVRVGSAINSPLVACEVSLFENDLLKLDFKQAIGIIQPGQSIVFYDQDEVLGGAEITCPILT